MNDKPQLGVIRVITASATFEIPYFGEISLADIIIKTKANGGFQNDAMFVPYRSIVGIMLAPNQINTSSEFVGMTKQ